MTSRPDNTWNLDDLTSYANDRADGLRRLARQTVEELYLFGESLYLVRDKKKGENKGWIKWLSEQPYSATSAFQAVKFFERVGSVDDLALLAGLTITEAKIALNVIHPKPIATTPKTARTAAKVKPTTTPSQDKVDGDDTTGDETGETDPAAAKDYLAKAADLLSQAEDAGVDASCSDLLQRIAETVSRLTFSLGTVPARTDIRRRAHV